MLRDPVKAAKDCLSGTIDWLRSDPRSELQWTARTEQLADCLNEMKRASATPSPAYLGHKPSAPEVSKKLLPAIPHVASMLNALMARNRSLAIEVGIGALEKLE